MTTRRQWLQSLIGLVSLLPFISTSRLREHVGHMDRSHPDARNTSVWFNGVNVTALVFSADSTEGRIMGFCTDEHGAKHGWHASWARGPRVIVHPQTHALKIGHPYGIQEFIGYGDVRLRVGPGQPPCDAMVAAKRLRAMLPQARASVSV